MYGQVKFNEPQLSPILVFAVGGRIGSGCSFVRNGLIQSLESYGYEVESIDVTKVFLEGDHPYLQKIMGTNGDGRQPQSAGDQGAELKGPAARIRNLQEIGNLMREHWGNEIITALCVSEVIKPHIEKTGLIKNGGRQAYIIDSLKHPDEVRFLRSVFNDAFYMIGVVARDEVRVERLREHKNVDEEAFRVLSAIDSDEQGIEYGQKAVHAVTEADYFFVNEYTRPSDIKPEADRVASVIFQPRPESPRRDELGMLIAFKAAARSACLSRQVGAAILDNGGRILGTGHNDVPKYNGALYGPESKEDHRCYLHGRKCYNDDEKSEIVDELLNGLRQAEGLKDKESWKHVESVVRSSRIGSLIEFCRAVHAEMDAIVSVARSASPGIVGSTLYCTTYPCHNCAKHIIDAGISKVVYLEPYEKSLARKLHADSIYGPSEKPNGEKVAFVTYGGVSPIRYDDFFTMRFDRKSNGKFVDRERKRKELLPTGAQESDILWNRVDRVAQKVDKVSERLASEAETH